MGVIVIVIVVVVVVVVVVVGSNPGCVSTNIAVSGGRGVRVRRVLAFFRRGSEFVFRCIAFSHIL